jgi:hypothetical protein
MKLVCGGSRLDARALQQPMDLAVMALAYGQCEPGCVVAETNVMRLDQVFCSAQCATRLIWWTFAFTRPHVIDP